MYSKDGPVIEEHWDLAIGSVMVVLRSDPFVSAEKSQPLKDIE